MSHPIPYEKQTKSRENVTIKEIDIDSQPIEDVAYHIEDYDFTPEESRALTRKFDWRILPVAWSVNDSFHRTCTDEFAQDGTLHQDIILALLTVLRCTCFKRLIGGCRESSIWCDTGSQHSAATWAMPVSFLYCLAAALLTCK